jgi:hypothetical protein
MRPHSSSSDLERSGLRNHEDLRRFWTVCMCVAQDWTKMIVHSPVTDKCRSVTLKSYIFPSLHEVQIRWFLARGSSRSKHEVDRWVLRTGWDVDSHLVGDLVVFWNKRNQIASRDCEVISDSNKWTSTNWKWTEGQTASRVPTTHSPTSRSCSLGQLTSKWTNTMEFFDMSFIFPRGTENFLR